jgi:hypothetical protein
VADKHFRRSLSPLRCLSPGRFGKVVVLRTRSSITDHGIWSQEDGSDDAPDALGDTRLTDWKRPGTQAYDPGNTLADGRSASCEQDLQFSCPC